MLNTILRGLTVLFFALNFSSPNAAELGDDGLHKADWMTVTFRDIAEDIESAKAENKRLAMFFEQRGCIYCKEMHELIDANPEIKEYLEANFMVVQYNIYGDEEVTDLDGDALSEKQVSRKWGLLFTPTILFMPEELSNEKSAKDAAVAIMPGAFKKGTFLDFLTWVNEKGYDGDEGFQVFHARRIGERRDAGVENTD